LYQKILDGKVLLFQVDAEEYDGDDDGQETKNGEGCSQVVLEVDRKVLERSGGYGPPLLHVVQDPPRRHPRRHTPPRNRRAIRTRWRPWAQRA
jgi:hypothetical protein